LTPEYSVAPDGSGIYFRSSENTIWFLPLDGNGRAAREPRLVDVPAIGSVVAHPSVSADGQHIAWTAVESSTQIWASYLRGNIITAPIGNVMPGSASAGNPSPSGELRTLFATHRDAVWNITAVSKATGEIRPLTKVASPRIVLRDPRWDLPNGRVLFERTETTGRIWTSEIPRMLR
jgi:outer membrane protein assembly factor BamB